MTWTEPHLLALESAGRATFRGVRQWQQDKKIREGARPELRVVDPEVDDVCAGVFNMASLMVRAMPPGDPQHEAGQTILKNYFPDGLGAFTRQVAMNQLQEVEILIEGLRGEHAAQAAVLHLDTLLARLEQLLPEYAAALGTTTKRSISYSQVQDMRRSDRSGLTLFIARLLIRREDTHDEADDINALLHIIHTAHNEQRKRNARPKKVDINPDTGDLEDAFI
jgi:hypothetical protein